MSDKRLTQLKVQTDVVKQLAEDLDRVFREKELLEKELQLLTGPKRTDPEMIQAIERTQHFYDRNEKELKNTEKQIRQYYDRLQNLVENCKIELANTSEFRAAVNALKSAENYAY